MQILSQRSRLHLRPTLVAVLVIACMLAVLGVTQYRQSSHSGDNGTDTIGSLSLVGSRDLSESAKITPDISEYAIGPINSNRRIEAAVGSFPVECYQSFARALDRLGRPFDFESWPKTQPNKLTRFDKGRYHDYGAIYQRHDDGPVNLNIIVDKDTQRVVAVKLDTSYIGRFHSFPSFQDFWPLINGSKTEKTFYCDPSDFVRARDISPQEPSVLCRGYVFGRLPNGAPMILGTSQRIAGSSDAQENLMMLRLADITVCDSADRLSDKDIMTNNPRDVVTSWKSIPLYWSPD